MNYIDIIGYFGSICVGLSFIPQTYKTITTDNVKSISFYTFLITFFSSICMIIYSIYYKIYPMLIANASVFLNSFIILVVYLYKKKD
jgi:uncharacterized protein with PQ loop repeat